MLDPAKIAPSDEQSKFINGKNSSAFPIFFLGSFFLIKFLAHTKQRPLVDPVIKIFLF